MQTESTPSVRSGQANPLLITALTVLTLHSYSDMKSHMLGNLSGAFNI